MCTPNLIKYCELWVDLRSLKLDLLKFSKKITKDENFVCEEYILDQINICHTI